MKAWTLRPSDDADIPTVIALHVNRANPAPKAVACMLHWQLRITGRREMSNREARSSSDAATSFGLTSTYLQFCIEEGAKAGLLRDDYLAGDARILLTEPG